MSDLEKLADLLEQAAAGLRRAAKELSFLPESNGRSPIKKARGYGSLSGRAKTVFKRAGVETVEDLCSKSEDELLAYGNCGLTTIEQINEFLAALGLNRLRRAN